MADFLQRLFCCCRPERNDHEMASLVAARDSDNESSEPSSKAASDDVSLGSWPYDAGRRLVEGPVDPLLPHWELLAAGATMIRRGNGDDSVNLSLSSDKSMLMWRGTGSQSGVVALSAVTKVGVPPPGWFASPAKGEFVIMCSDGVELRLVVDSEQLRDAWIFALTVVSEKAAADRGDRQLGREARRRLDLEMRRREAERRKAALDAKRRDLVETRLRPQQPAPQELTEPRPPSQPRPDPRLGLGKPISPRALELEGSGL